LDPLLVPRPPTAVALTKPFRIEADSSDFATGAVLSQISSEDEKWHPVAFLSKSLSPIERNYEIHDKEMLAVRATAVRRDAVLAGDPKVFRLLCNTNLNKNIPSRGSKEERIRILLRVWANIQGNRYNK